jgi:membrane-anchored protein YejM (alkaline phosphatase superfamily)
VDWVASQIDVAPTVLALLRISYISRFFGQDILTEGRKHQRAFMANYLTVGYMEDGLVVELSPKRRVRVLEAESGKPLSASDPRAQHFAREAIGYYELATEVLAGHHHGRWARPPAPASEP